MMSSRICFNAGLSDLICLQERLQETSPSDRYPGDIPASWRYRFIYFTLQNFTFLVNEVDPPQIVIFNTNFEYI